MVDNDKQSSIPLQSMQKPEDVDEFSPNDTLEIKSVRGLTSCEAVSSWLVAIQRKKADRVVILFRISFFVLSSAYTPCLTLFATHNIIIDAYHPTCAGCCGIWTGWNLPARLPPRLNLKRSTSPHGSVSLAVLLLCSLSRFFAENLENS